MPMDPADVDSDGHSGEYWMTRLQTRETYFGHSVRGGLPIGSTEAHEAVLRIQKQVFVKDRSATAIRHAKKAALEASLAGRPVLAYDGLEDQ